MTNLIHVWVWLQLYISYIICFPLVTSVPRCLSEVTWSLAGSAAAICLETSLFEYLNLAAAGSVCLVRSHNKAARRGGSQSASTTAAAALARIATSRP